MALRTEQATLPQHLRASYSRVKKPRNNPYQSFAFILIGIVVLIVLSQALLMPSHNLPARAQLPSPAMPTLIPPAITHTAVPLPPPTASLTTAPDLIMTDEVISKHRLEQPIGRDYKFVIHRVLYGENLNQFAAKYNTSIEAIMLINYDLKTPVWVDALVIIPVEFTDVSGLPAFQPYEVIRTGLSLKVLALGFGVNLEELKYYNAIDTADTLEAGDWLLMPRHKPEQ